MVTKTKPIPTIPFLRANFPEDLYKELSGVFESGYVGAGEWVTKFERALEKYLNASTILATSSCTGALMLSYIAAGIKPSDVVLSTPMTCAATNIPLLQIGARIDWLDVDPMYGNVTAESVADGFRRQPDAKAVVIMDWGGVPCEYPEIASECRKRKVPLILDAAQSFGSSYAGKIYPQEIDYVCYSFGPTKLFSTVEGGAIALKNPTDIERLKALRWYGIHRESRDSMRFWQYTINEIGYRYIFNNLFAAIGLRMLPLIKKRIEHHRNLARVYDELLGDVSGLQIGTRPSESAPNFWLYTILADRREDLLTKLHADSVHAATPHRRNDVLLAEWNINSPAALRGVEKFDRSYVCLPIGSWMQAEDIETVCKSIRSGW